MLKTSVVSQRPKGGGRIVHVIQCSVQRPTILLKEVVKDYKKEQIFFPRNSSPSAWAVSGIALIHNKVNGMELQYQTQSRDRGGAVSGKKNKSLHLMIAKPFLTNPEALSQ